MILVDTSVWIDHLHTGDERLIDLLDSSQVLAHPFVIGELACGNLRKRTEVLRLPEAMSGEQKVSQDRSCMASANGRYCRL